MNVTACVEATRLGRLRAALADRHRLFAALDWEHADHLLRHEPVDVLVVDPLVQPDAPSVAAIAKLRAAHPGVPTVLYSALAPAACGPVAQIGRAGVATLILHDVDDTPEALLRVLERQPGVSLSSALLDQLAPRLRTMPDGVARAITRAVHTPSAFRDVPDLAAAAGISRRTLYRECERAALASPRELLAGARALRAYALLRDASLSIEDTAAALRYSSPHHLANAMRWACGTTTARARAQVPPAAFIAQLSARLMPTASSP